MTRTRTIEAQRCNIGPAEIARRRRVAIVLTAVTALVAIALVASGLPVIARGILWPIASATAVTWLQVVRRFCVRFGTTGVQNFGPLGQETEVPPGFRDIDRRRAIQLVFEGLLAGLLFTVAFYNLPL